MTKPLDMSPQNSVSSFELIKTNTVTIFTLKKDEVIFESLYRKAITGKKAAKIFERDTNEISLGYTIARKSINTNVNPKMPYLSFLAINYDISVITEVMTWFESCIIRSYANPMVERQLMLSNNTSYKKAFIHALNDMNIDITDYRYDEDNHQLFMKRVLDAHEYELPFSQESDGTKKLPFCSIPVLLLALQEGRLVIIDELDAKLHPKTFTLCNFLV